MKNIFTEMNQINDHFFKESDKLIEKYKKTFGVHNVGGRQVIDLTSIDSEYSRPKMLGEDIERQRIYGSDAWNPNFL